MPTIALTVLIAAIVVARSPIPVDSSPQRPIQGRPDNDPIEPPPLPPPPPPSKTPGPPVFSSPPSPTASLVQTGPAGRDPSRPVNRPGRNNGLGRKIGVIFLGMAVVLQVAAVGFLGFKRWQISTIKESAAESSSV